MSNQQLILRYLKISFGLIIPIALLFFVLHRSGVPTTNTLLGAVGLGIGGGSTAIAGLVTAKTSGKVSKYGEVLRDFFALRQPASAYFLVFTFLLLNFGAVFRPISLRSFLGYFLLSLLFGGIEELGWRYIFQPMLEVHYSFVSATLLTALAWGLWHILYFVLNGALFSMTATELVIFFIGLLGNSFILAAIFFITESLWLCVLYHACLNAFTQLLGGGNLLYSIILTLLSMGVSCLLVYWTEKGRVSR
ncbi:CAAX amino protease [Enterococcus florum]|uniref:CAAX amino protease n=1 Tax=Enterococcus florum TaxID=2480627 RepID=A0A4P5PDN0_9ENTE|nr:CPBP family intramembrane glutamic endopeptidase [Enterococcus florum]GCF94168.1 CAAX amino protease [Enterococcus florum]